MDLEEQYTVTNFCVNTGRVYVYTLLCGQIVEERVEYSQDGKV
jgi:hypothetical protein